ncbi:APC family permease [Streptomyces sp. CA-135486]|uniref:APC family permease n=1 Tax=Streptomyces sp. CA-135486 TaxID=3240049 RepID=UPI003D8D613E
MVILGFVPMLFIAYAYKAMNSVDPDCGTTFAWSARAFGPRTAWMGGWGIIIADIIVMANLAQIAGQYGFQLVGADGLADSRGWTALAGVIWIAVMTVICYIGIEISAFLQKWLLSIELVLLAILSVVALVKVYGDNPHPESLHVNAAWFNPFEIGSASALTQGVLLAVFIYWGWDTAVSVNEETADRERTPGRAAVISTVLLLLIYLLVTTRRGVRHGRIRRVPGETAGPDGAHLRGGLHADDDPADSPYQLLDGHAQGASRGLRARPPAIPDTDLVDGRHGTGIDCLLRRTDGHQRQCWTDRFRLCVVLPQGSHP